MKTVAYGMRCLWWDLREAAIIRRGKPHCPVCGGHLAEIEEDDWMDGIVNNAYPEYREIMEFARGQCFRSFPALLAEFRIWKGEEI